MKFAIQINCTCNQSSGDYTAYRFIISALNKGYQIHRVFFYHDGSATAILNPFESEGIEHTVEKWTQLSSRYGIDLVVCVSAAQRRGLIAMDNAEQKHEAARKLAPGFRISGLGQLVESIIESDRFLIFGN